MISGETENGEVSAYVLSDVDDDEDEGLMIEFEDDDVVLVQFMGTESIDVFPSMPELEDEIRSVYVNQTVVIDDEGTFLVDDLERIGGNFHVGID